MNGDAKEIYDRIVTLETQMIERWKSHERRSDDFKNFIDEKFRSLPCIPRLKDIDDKFKLVWTFITVIIVAIVSISIKTLFKV